MDRRFGLWRGRAGGLCDRFRGRRMLCLAASGGPVDRQQGQAEAAAAWHHAASAGRDFASSRTSPRPAVTAALPPAPGAAVVHPKKVREQKAGCSRPAAVAGANTISTKRAVADHREAFRPRPRVSAGGGCGCYQSDFQGQGLTLPTGAMTLPARRSLGLQRGRSSRLIEKTGSRWAARK